MKTPRSGIPSSIFLLSGAPLDSSFSLVIFRRAFRVYMAVPVRLFCFLFSGRPPLLIILVIFLTQRCVLEDRLLKNRGEQISRGRFPLRRAAHGEDVTLQLSRNFSPTCSTSCCSIFSFLSIPARIHLINFGVLNQADEFGFFFPPV